MTNIIRAVFEPNKYNSTATRPDNKPIYQWDYGKILEVHGLDLLKATEVHFAHGLSGGDAVIRIGTTTDKITSVAVPEAFLEQAGDATAYVYKSDTESGQTEYKIQFKVIERPKPEAWDAPEDGELFREVIEVVNIAADKAESGAERAETAAEIAESARIETLSARDVAVNARNSAQESAQVATQQAGRAKNEADNAEESAGQALISSNDAKTAQVASEVARDAANTHAQTAASAAGEAEGSAVRAETAANKAEQSETVIESAVETINTAKVEIENMKIESVQAISDEGNTQTQRVTQEGDDQILAIQAEAKSYAQMADIEKVAFRGTSFGSDIHIDDSAEWPLMDISLFGQSAQAGTPTESTPIAIVSKGNSGNIKTKVMGKNLLNLPKSGSRTIYDVTLTYLSNGSMSFTGTNNGTSSSPFSFDIKNSGLKSGNYFVSGSSGNILFRIAVRKTSTSSFFYVNSGSFYTFDDFLTYDTILAQAIVPTSKSTDIVLYPMLHRGASAAFWEPYKGRESTITLAEPLRGIPVSTGGNVTIGAQQYIADYRNYRSGKSVKRIGYIESYAGESITTPYMSATGVLTEGATIIYVLDAPIETNIPASELAEIRALSGYYGATNILNDDDVYTQVTYVRDPKLYLQKELDEIRAAIVAAGSGV